MKRSTYPAILCVMLLAFSFVLTACGKSQECPRCSNKVNFSKEAFCSNCGMTFSGIKPDGYSEETDDSNKSNAISIGSHKRVPDSVIHNQLGNLYEIADNIKIQHSIDNAAHIDTVTVTLTFDTKYAKTVGMRAFQYQYDKSSDLWTDITDSGDWDFSENLKDFTKKYPKIQGVSNNIDYYIVVNRVDTENNIIFGSYIVKDLKTDTVSVKETPVPIQTEIFSWGEVIAYITPDLQIVLNPEDHANVNWFAR